MGTFLGAAQVEPGKAPEVPSNQQPPKAKPANDQPAHRTVSGLTPEALREIALEACVASGLPQVYEYGLDQDVKPVTYEEAMSMDIGPLPWQRIRQMNQLHQDLERRVRMTGEQKKLLSTRFHQIYATMIEHPVRSGWREFNYPTLEPEARTALEAEIAQAEKNGETSKADALRMMVLQGTFGTEQNISPPIEINIHVLKDKMDPDQREVFKKVFDRWYQMESRSPMDAPPRMLLRALKDPDLQLDQAFLDKAEARILEKLATLPAPPERRQHMARIGDELKTELLVDLPPEKRAAVENSYAYLKNQRQAVDEYTREAAKRHATKTGSRNH